MLSHDDDIIVAQCTPIGKGAIALLRLSGKDTRALVASCALLASGKNILEVASHTIHYGWVTDDTGKHLDQVMFLVMDGPKTFTGTDVIEVTCHNNQFLVELLLAQFIKKGARPAQEGEFTKRAFMHNKMDLLQAEAINELIGATTQLALKKSLAQLEGSFSYWIQSLEHDLLRSLAWCEASFEFLDEEREFGDRIRSLLEELLTKIDSLKKSFNAQQQIRKGINIALIGSVNAGKSSLFNALLNQKRAIVNDRAGTTRDVIEATLSVKGNFWTLIDTAGLRQTEDTIEAEGIRKSHEEAQKADIILVVIDQSRIMAIQEENEYKEILKRYRQKCITIYNKCDLPAVGISVYNHPFIEVSSATGTHITKLQEIIEEKIATLFDLYDSPFLLNRRQHALLLALEEKIKKILGLLVGTVQYELVSYQLTDALTLLSELTGKSISEAGLDMVFKEFCVGK